MSHAISVKNGKAEMAYYGDQPWHSLGTKVNEAMTSAQAIELAGLNWDVEKQPIYIKDPKNSNNMVQVDDQYAIVRKDTGMFFATCGRVYRALQNKEAFSFFDSIVGTKAAMYHTAGALFDGKKIWLLAKLPDI